MKKILVSDFIKLCNGKLVMGEENEELKSFTNNTKNIEKGDTYVGFVGEHNDGNLFYEKAFQNGAKACVLKRESVETKLNVEKIRKYYVKIDKKRSIH